MRSYYKFNKIFLINVTYKYFHLLLCYIIKLFYNKKMKKNE